MLRHLVVAASIALCPCATAAAQFGVDHGKILTNELKKREKEVREAIERRDQEKKSEAERKEQARKKREAEEKAAAEATQREAAENRRKAEAAEVSQLRDMVTSQIAKVAQLELDFKQAQLDIAAERLQAAMDKSAAQNNFDVEKARAAKEQAELELEKLKVENQATQWWWGAVGTVLLAMGGIVAFMWRIVVDKATMSKLYAEIDTLKNAAA